MCGRRNQGLSGTRWSCEDHVLPREHLKDSLLLTVIQIDVRLDSPVQKTVKQTLRTRIGGKKFQ